MKKEFPDEMNCTNQEPRGLFNKYYIQKIVWHEKEQTLNDVEAIDLLQVFDSDYELKECDPEAEYFVLRLDENGKDKKHIDACRKAVLCYAENIKDHLPKLAEDLVKRYGC